MRRRVIGFGVVLAVAAFGCGGNGNTYTCTYSASAGICAEWDAAQALNSSQVTTLQNYCTSGVGITGTFSTGVTCPSASRVGTCALTTTQVSGTSSKFVFYTPIYSATTGQQACTAFSGTWTAG